MEDQQGACQATRVNYIYIYIFIYAPPPRRNTRRKIAIFGGQSPIHRPQARSYLEAGDAGNALQARRRELEGGWTKSRCDGQPKHEEYLDRPLVKWARDLPIRGGSVLQMVVIMLLSLQQPKYMCVCVMCACVCVCCVCVLCVCVCSVCVCVQMQVFPVWFCPERGHPKEKHWHSLSWSCLLASKPKRRNAPNAIYTSNLVNLTLTVEPPKGSGYFHLLKNMVYFLPVELKGNLSLLEICLFLFQGAYPPSNLYGT